MARKPTTPTTSVVDPTTLATLVAVGVLTQEVADILAGITAPTQAAPTTPTEDTRPEAPAPTLTDRVNGRAADTKTYKTPIPAIEPATVGTYTAKGESIWNGSRRYTVGMAGAGKVEVVVHPNATPADRVALAHALKKAADALA